MIPEYEVRFTIKLPCDDKIENFRSIPVGKSLFCTPTKKYFGMP